METDIKIYTPDAKRKIGFIQTWVIMFRNIARSKNLIWQLFKRDFLATYKKSFLGFSWILISPIIGIISWVLLNSAQILQPGETPIPYLPYVLISSSMWGLFMGFYSSAAGTLGAGAGFILQVKYPHEVLLVKQTAQHLANFSITFIINIVVLLLFGVVPDWKIILLPFLALPMFFLGSAIGLIVSIVAIVASDLTNIINVILGFIFYITPIVYSQSRPEGFFKTMVELNPLTYLVAGVRDIIITGEMTNPNLYLIYSVVAFLFFMISWRMFFVAEDKVIERII